MQGGVFITPQEAMEPGPNEALIDYESSLRLKAVKIKLSFPQQIVEEHEHVRDTTHPPKHYGCIYVTRSLYEVTFPMSYRNVGSSCPHYRERRRSPHRTDSDALYAVGGGNTDPASSVTTNFTPYYLDKKYRREDTPVYFNILFHLIVVSLSPICVFLSLCVAFVVLALVFLPGLYSAA